MTTVKIVKWMTAWKKIHYADPVNDIKSVAGFSPSRQLVGRNEHGYSFKMAASEVASFETNFFTGAGTSEAEAECLLQCYWRRQQK